MFDPGFPDAVIFVPVTHLFCNSNKV